MCRFSISVVVVSLFLIMTGITRSFGADDEVLARIGNEGITKIDFEARLKSFPPGIQEALKDFEKRKQFLDSMIKARLFVVEGRDKGLTEKADIKAKLEMMRDDFITQEYVKAYIEKKVEVSEEEVEKYYNTDPKIKEREYLRVSQIVVEKEAEAREILGALKKGEHFKKLARERSIDPEGKYRAGELELFEKGKGKKEIEDAVSKLEKGGISDIVKTKEGYSIFKLDDRKIDPKIPYLKVKDEIMRKLKLKKLTELVENEIEELKKKIPVEVFYDKLTPEAK
jgi:peptidyl-prolyl cis-trans isomerase C